MIWGPTCPVFSSSKKTLSSVCRLFIQGSCWGGRDGAIIIEVKEGVRGDSVRGCWCEGVLV